MDAFDIMERNFWVPCATLIIGFPGETEKDVELTIDLIEELKSYKSLIVPLLLVSITVHNVLGNAKSWIIFEHHSLFHLHHNELWCYLKNL